MKPTLDGKKIFEQPNRSIASERVNRAALGISIRVRRQIRSAERRGGGGGKAEGRGTERCEHSLPAKAISARRCAAELRSPSVPPRRPMENTEGRFVAARCRLGGFLIFISSEENPGPSPFRQPPSGCHRRGSSLSGLCCPGLCSSVSLFDRRGEKKLESGHSGGSAVSSHPGPSSTAACLMYSPVTPGIN